MATAGVTHHVVLDGVGYMLRRGKDGRLAWRRGERRFFDALRWVADERQAQARPGVNNGGMAAGVVGAYGSGGYGRGVGVDGRNGDGLRIASVWDTVSGGDIVITSMVDFNGTVYGASSSGTKGHVWKYSVAGNSLSEIGPTGGAAIQTLVAFGSMLWGSEVGGVDLATWNTSDSYASSSGPNSSGRGLGRTGSRCFAWLSGSASVRLAGVSGGMGAGEAFTGSSGGFDPNEPKRWAGCELDGVLYVGMDGGLYRMGWDGSGEMAARAVDWTGLRATGNGWPMVVWRGYLWYQVGGSLYRFDGNNEKGFKVPALLVGATGQGTVGGKVAGLAVTANWLLVAMTTDEATPAVELFAFDGVETWHHLGVVGSGASAVVNSMWYSPNLGQLFVNYTAGGSSVTKRMRLVAGSDLPYASFATAGNYVYLAGVDAGLPEVVKRWHSVVIRGRDISAVNAVGVAYWDGGGWVSAGTVTGATGGEVVLGGAVAGGSLLLRLELKGTSTTTPVVQEVGVNYDYLPGPLGVVEFEALLGPNVRRLDGTVEAMTAAQLLGALEAARAGGAVVELEDPVTSTMGGAAMRVRLTSVEVEAWGLAPEPGTGYGWVAAVKAEVVG